MGKDEKKAFEFLNKNRQIQKPIIAQYNGKWIKELGDGVLASFNTVSDAVNAAIKIQQTCNALKEFQLRIGIHLGEVIFENDDVFGDGVNVASRIQAIASPGSIFISEAVHNSISNKKDFQTRFFIEQKLKNVTQPIKVYQIIADGVVTAHQHLNQKIKPNRNVLIITIALLIILAAIFLFKGLSTPKPANTISSDTSLEKSIAVLPFRNISPDTTQEYFSDGLSEELLNLLAKNPQLKVIGRTSSFSFKGKNEDLRTIAQKLGVSHLLEGTVRKDGNKIRITTQLIDGSNGIQQWNSSYNRDFQNIFELQEEIAQDVVTNLKVQLLSAPLQTSSSSTNTEVYNLILQGAYFLERRGKENIEKALEFYLKALSIDSLDARCWSGVARCYNLKSNWSYIDRNEGYKKAEFYANKALALDKNQTLAYIVLGAVKMFRFDWSGAEAEFQKALKLEPGNAEISRILGFLYRCLGRFEEAILLNKKSISLDPLKPITYFNYGQLLYHANKYEEAIASYKKLLEINPKFPRAHIFLGKVYLMEGKSQLVLTEMLQEEDEAWQNFGLILAYYDLQLKKKADSLLTRYIVDFEKENEFQIAEIYAYHGEKDKAFQWLEKAYATNASRLNYVKGDPLLRSLKSDPRHAAFLKKLNLPPD
jgi:TolB-like protein